MDIGDYLVNVAITKLLQYQSNGDLCIYDLPASITTYIQTTNTDWQLSWCLGARSDSPFHASINQDTGKFELVSTTGYAYWQSASVKRSYSAKYLLLLQDDWNLVFYASQGFDDDTASNYPMWACGSTSFAYYKDSVYYATSSNLCNQCYSEAACHPYGYKTTTPTVMPAKVPSKAPSTLKPPTLFPSKSGLTPVNKYLGDRVHSKMDIGDYIVNNAKSRALQYQSNGDLCIYDLPAATTSYTQYSNADWISTWCLGAASSSPSSVNVNQDTGKLELLTTTGYAYWQSASTVSYSAKYLLLLQDDWNLVFYAGRGFDDDDSASNYLLWTCGNAYFSYYRDSVYYATSSNLCDQCDSYSDCYGSSSGTKTTHYLATSAIVAISVTGSVCSLLIVACIVGFVCRPRKDMDFTVKPVTTASTSISTAINSTPTIQQVPLSMYNYPPVNANYQQSSPYNPSAPVYQQYQPVSSNNYAWNGTNNNPTPPIVYGVPIVNSAGSYELVCTNKGNNSDFYAEVEAHTL